VMLASDQATARFPILTGFGKLPTFTIR
jgi:hypothetical protein